MSDVWAKPDTRKVANTNRTVSALVVLITAENMRLTANVLGAPITAGNTHRIAAARIAVILAESTLLSVGAVIAVPMDE